MAAEESSETNWRRRWITGNNDNYHDLTDATIRSCQQEKSNTIGLIEFEHHCYMSIERNHQPKPRTQNGVIVALNRQYREPKAQSKGDLLVNTVPAQDQSQLRLHSFYLSEVHLSQFVCTPTALATSTKPTCGGFLRPRIPTDTLLEPSMLTKT